MSNKTLLIIAFVWPEPSSTAAGNRMLQLVDFFIERGYNVTMASTASRTKRSCDLEAMGVSKVSILLNDPSFDEFVCELNPDIVLFDRFLAEEQFGWRVAELVPKAVRILDTEDLHSLRHSRQEALKNGVSFTIALWLKDDMTKREVASILRSDLTLIISTYEMRLLKTLIRVTEGILIHLPFMIDIIDEQDKASWPSFDDRTDFLCIGNGKHAPNIDAIRWLKKEIWPLIRKTLPKAALNVYGAYLPVHIQQMHNPKEGFLVRGWVENKSEVFQNARINLAPLRFGAGIKGKLIDAMQAGTPSITTHIGAEGMHDGLDWSGGIEEQPTDFAKAAIQLYEDEALWRQAQQNGMSIINRLYAKKKHCDHFQHKTNTILEDLEAHRAQNFVGAVLQHQTMAATKYMSKWIEEKNSD